MNHITNDRGDVVLAIGAPGSIARAKCCWPALINRLNDLFYQVMDGPSRHSYDVAIERIIAVGIDSKMEIDAVLGASVYGSWLNKSTGD